ncbi:glycosyl transferase group 1 [Pseudodesulfovibrio mercurii]|uniref:Glycosyl transferase group 1 n=1 Tax=Pseudodesulfovibrio mercurii TaxID=641491 RepID=F0JCA6_9BACT|nr:glycosyltransferase family 4 protein [Pseudodesulfovibrio mercurii]EGB14404.1 glycosyl transferase group 1 [Pseudodesulfovibrio mercurii]
MSRGSVLFATARPPYPLDTGAKIRTWNILSGFVDRYDVDVLHFIDPAVEAGWRKAAAALGVREIFGMENPDLNRPAAPSDLLAALIRGLPVSTVKYAKADFAARFRELAPNYDLVHVDTIHLAGGLGGLGNGGGAPFTTLNAHNVEYQIAERMRDLERSLPRRLALGLHARNMRRFETRAFREAGMVLAVSGEDGGQIDALAGQGKGVLVENGVDVNFYTPADDPADAPGRADNLVFVGSMDWLPNIDGMKWFVRDILPAIRAARPGARITIVGRSPHPDVQALHDPAAGVVVTGTVDDVRPFVREASVVVVPLRFGGGTRLKILEAFAMGKAVLSTALGCEGILCEDGRHLRIEDEAAPFARRCLELMDDEDARRRLGAEGRELALSRYSWDAVVGRMHEAVDREITKKESHA